MLSTETCHFWLGYFPDVRAMASYFEEHYDGEDDTPVSTFARDQGETWYDHDFLEIGFSADAASIKELVAGYSYYDQYTEELAERAKQLPLTRINSFVFITESQISAPRTVETDDFQLYYVGKITYQI